MDQRLYLPKCLSISCIGRKVTSLRHFSSSLCRSLAMRYKHINCPLSTIVPSEMHLQQTNWLYQQRQLQPIKLKRDSLLHVRQQGAVGPHHLLDCVHPDLPDPLTQLRTVSRTAHSEEEITKLGNL